MKIKIKKFRGWLWKAATEEMFPFLVQIKISFVFEKSFAHIS